MGSPGVEVNDIKVIFPSPQPSLSCVCKDQPGGSGVFGKTLYCVVVIS